MRASHKVDQKGFSALEPLLLLVIVGLVGFTGWYVWHAKQSANKTLSSASSTSSSVAKISTKNTATTPLANASTVSTGPAATSSSKPSTAKTSTTTTPSATAPTPAPTPLDALTTIIANLKSGSAEASVTSNAVTVPGPISSATARPIVFTVDGQLYFAYTQGSSPNFGTSAATTAGTMAIVKATVSNPPLIQAYLDKTDKLTDANFHQDGFSTGGN